jgi:CheY-like chemotaxis protein
MSQHLQTFNFDLKSSSPRAWLVVQGGDAEPLVIEMSKAFPNHWSANALLTPGEYRCRFYCGDDHNVTYFGPASVNGSTEAGMDALVSIRIEKSKIVPQAINILVVEDDLDTLAVFSRLLRTDGYSVCTADGYQAAMDVAKKERVDLAVCDIGLWDGNGCDLLGELQKLHRLKAIAVTGLIADDEVERYREAGFAAVLAKPCQHSKLKSVISELIDIHQDRSAGTATGEDPRPASDLSSRGE